MTTEAPSPSPRPRWRVVFALWSIPALISAVQLLSMDTADGKAVELGNVVLNLVPWFLWALATPAIFAFTRRNPIRPPHRLRALARHLLLGSAVAVATALVLLPLDLLLQEEPAALWTEGSPWQHVGRFLAVVYPTFLLVYAILVVIGSALDLRHRYRREVLATAQLEARNAHLEQGLTEARLQALRMQLQPHFLFNTLHAISALMDRDVAAARRMLTRLGDLLRATLEVPPEIPLEEELELLEHYLAIERVRFGERLQVHYDIAPEAAATAVPSLLLQPLVENAIRHGVAPHAGAGRVTIRAVVEPGTAEADTLEDPEAQDDATLHLTVADDGPGPGAAPAEGIGLQNTGDRLRQRYGERAGLTLTATAEGCEARLHLPARPAPAATDTPEEPP